MRAVALSQSFSAGCSLQSWHLGPCMCPGSKNYSKAARPWCFMISSTLGARSTGELCKLRAFFTPLCGDTMMQRMKQLPGALVGLCWPAMGWCRCTAKSLCISFGPELWQVSRRIQACRCPQNRPFQSPRLPEPAKPRGQTSPQPSYELRGLELRLKGPEPKRGP